MSELEVLDASPTEVTLKSGVRVNVERIRLRQLLRLFKILTHGAGPLMKDFGEMLNADAEELGSQLAVLLAISIPDAEDESIEFFRSMVKPVGLIEKRNISKAESEHNDELWNAVLTDIYNPELDDILNLIKTIVSQEAEHLRELGKQLTEMLLALNPPQETGSRKSQGKSTSGTSPKR